METLRLQCLRDSTRKNYYQIWKSFNQFFIRLDVKPSNWADRLTLFAAYLISKKRQSSTIRSYISAIKSTLKDNNIKINENCYLLSSLIRACKLQNDRIKTRLPIGKSLLHLLLNSIWSRFLQNNQVYLAQLYTTIFITMFYGMFRIGELALGPHTVVVNDVHISENKVKLLFVLWTSKTHTKGSRPQKIKIKKNSQKRMIRQKPDNNYNACKWCLFAMLSNYVRIRRSAKQPSEPFFIFRDRSPVQPKHLREVLCKALQENEFNSSLYSVHSLRAGRALQLLKLGVSVETIKCLGRWKSNAVFRYLK